MRRHWANQAMNVPHRFYRTSREPFGKPQFRWPYSKLLFGAVLAAAILAGMFSGLFTVSGHAYPLDGDAYTGIERLEGYRLAQEGKVKGRKLPKGALLGIEQVHLRLLDHRSELEIPEPDERFVEQIRGFLGDKAEAYAFAVLDLSDPEHPRYAEHRGTVLHNPGSVGKLMVALGVFQALADIYPTDIDRRLHVLRNSMVMADAFIQYDHHVVPFWDREKRVNSRRPIQLGDTANLWTYLDWMLSASSNAAAATNQKHLMLMGHFGREYPVSNADADQFFKNTKKRELGALLTRVLHDPISRNGLDPEQLRQGSLFTREGKKRVPGTKSYGTARELLKYLLRLEQGRLVDAFSSREIKRLLYMTQRRIRYASSPALYKAAAYFKSGSLYKCKAEPGFKCYKYHGNVQNFMNSVAIVEAPAGEAKLYYMTTVMSNVLRKNSAVEHQTFATRLHRAIEEFHRRAGSGSEEPGTGK